jgi:methionyl aminopeptidase
VHGIPGPRVLREGDIVSIDTGCRLNGWCGDAAVTHAVGSVGQRSQSLLQTTRKALAVALELIGPDVNWGTVARAMERPVVEAGFSVVTSMVGHGIGRQMHEAPQVPNYWSAEWMRDNDFVLRPGMVLAIEPMVNAGSPELKCLDDGWTQIAADRSLAAHFEHTVAVTRDGSRRLTGPPAGAELEEMPDWLGPPGNWVHW